MGVRGAPCGSAAAGGGWKVGGFSRLTVKQLLEEAELGESS